MRGVETEIDGAALSLSVDIAQGLDDRVAGIVEIAGTETVFDRTQGEAVGACANRPWRMHGEGFRSAGHVGAMSLHRPSRRPYQIRSSGTWNWA